MSRNLITRMGVASGVVAALVAGVFSVLVLEASTLREDAQRAGRAGATPAQVREAVQDADRHADRAQALAVGGAVAATVLLFLLTRYLSNYIVVPLRRTGRAAARLAEGDLSARVTEEGDAEPLELARAFNAMASNLEQARARAEHDERLKDEFFALVSHELRTPLTSIIGYLELVLGDDEELSDEARRFLEVVQRNARRLLRLVGDMLFVAQVEAGRLALERTDVDLALVAQESLEAARPAADRGKVTLVLEATPVPQITGDRDRFGQMLDNLISNALKFTPDGGRVTVRVHVEEKTIVVAVADDGAGIPAADLDRLFERFFRSSTATDRAIPGAGLGLTIVQTIVEAHGGTVAVTSTEGVGTTVEVRLPCLV